MKKKYLMAAAVALVSFSSCSTNGGFSIPGENDVVVKNLVTEYMNIAKAYDDLKKYDKAIEYYQMAMNADKNKTLMNSAYYSIGHCYAMAKDWDNARKVYEGLLEKDGGNTNIKISIAYIDAMSGDLERACGGYKALCEENPTNVSLLKNYISVLIAAEKKDDAEKALSVLAEKFPDDTSLKEIQQAVESLKKDSESSGEK